MRRTIIGAAVLLVFAGTALAEERTNATTKEAEMMVHKAVALLKKEGPEKALATFNDAKGPFTYLDLYVWVMDLDGKVLAHGKNPAFVGRNDTKDAKGKYGFAAKVLEVGKGPGKGWLEYSIENPVTHQVEPKVAYIERVDDMIVICGAFKPQKG